ncbi:hypothetical protein HUF15_15725 [Streptomyces samsunensis]|uniref:Uncharacterized protein n=1 Tax=Streptomyces rugosispiralis TaxID=2967341 RepID=A0ABT1V7T7_9ACTN|nr:MULTISPECIES: hypothetical protein [Streptomyces]MCQ8193444.1 hypothetical protein [Streptomyces rugosispiralis]NUH38199.1 hypothetical protein [Streptomyces samsunensis]
MCGHGGDGFEGDAADLEAGIWVRGVDYLSGWRDAREATAELGDALSLVGVEAAGLRLRAATGPDGAGVVRLELSPGSAREVAMLARVTAARLGRAG